jgi:hypothetical protein
LLGDTERPGLLVGNATRAIKVDGSLGEEKPVSFNDVPATEEEVKVRFSHVTGGRELVLAK